MSHVAGSINTTQLQPSIHQQSSAKQTCHCKKNAIVHVKETCRPTCTCHVHVCMFSVDMMSMHLRMYVPYFNRTFGSPDPRACTTAQAAQQQMKLIKPVHTNLVTLHTMHTMHRSMKASVHGRAEPSICPVGMGDCPNYCVLLASASCGEIDASSTASCCMVWMLASDSCQPSCCCYIYACCWRTLQMLGFTLCRL